MYGPRDWLAHALGLRRGPLGLSRIGVDDVSLCVAGLDAWIFGSILEGPERVMSTKKRSQRQAASCNTPKGFNCGFWGDGGWVLVRICECSANSIGDCGRSP